MLHAAGESARPRQAAAGARATARGPRRCRRWRCVRSATRRRAGCRAAGRRRTSRAARPRPRRQRRRRRPPPLRAAPRRSALPPPQRRRAPAAAAAAAAGGGGEEERWQRQRRLSPRRAHPRQCSDARRSAATCSLRAVCSALRQQGASREHDNRAPIRAQRAPLARAATALLEASRGAHGSTIAPQCFVALDAARPRRRGGLALLPSRPPHAVAADEFKVKFKR